MPVRGCVSLTRKRDFKDVFDHGIRSSSPYLVIYVRPNGLPYSRLGLSVGRKIGTAVVRNRVKRRLRAAARPLLNEAQCDMVIVARGAAGNAPIDDLGRAISRVLTRLAHEKYTDRSDKAV